MTDVRSTKNRKDRWDNQEVGVSREPRSSTVIHPVYGRRGVSCDHEGQGTSRVPEDSKDQGVSGRTRRTTVQKVGKHGTSTSTDQGNSTTQSHVGLCRRSHASSTHRFGNFDGAGATKKIDQSKIPTPFSSRTRLQLPVPRKGDSHCADSSSNKH